MDAKIKPCPFCGGVAQRVDIPADEHDPNAGGSYIACKFCLASSSIAFGDKSSLVDNWNTRADDASIRAEARAEAASLYERQYEELRTWNAERSTQERWWDMIARHKHERDVFILADEPKERESKHDNEDSFHITQAQAAEWHTQLVEEEEENKRLQAQHDELLEVVKYTRQVLPQDIWANDLKVMLDTAISNAEKYGA